MIEYLSRIFQNVFNNVKGAAETPTGETVGSVILIIIVGFIVCAVACVVGSLISSIFKGARINLAGMLAGVVGEFMVLGSAVDKGALEYISGGIMILIGIALAGMTIFVGYEKGWGFCPKSMAEGYSYFYAAFALSVFAFSPAWYDLLPGNINKWCLYVPMFLAEAAVIGSFSDHSGKEDSE